MRHKVTKSTTRRRVMGAALGASALANGAVGMLALPAADAATQTWTRLCIRNGGLKTGGADNASDVYVIGVQSATPATTGCAGGYINVNIPNDWTLFAGAQGPQGAQGPEMVGRQGPAQETA